MSLEPAFIPCSDSRDDVQAPRDDARVKRLHEHAWSLGKFLVRGLSRRKREAEEDEAVPALVSDQELVELRLTPPADLRSDAAAMQRLLASLPTQHMPLAFELVGDHEAVSMHLVVEEGDLRAVLQQLKVQMPGLVVSRARKALRSRWEGLEDAGAFVVDFGLSVEVEPSRGCERAPLGRDFALDCRAQWDALESDPHVGP